VHLARHPGSTRPFGAASAALGLLALLAALVAPAAPARAATSFTVAGGNTTDLDLVPGAATATAYTVVNEGDTPSRFRIRVTGLHFKDATPQFSGQPSSGIDVTVDRPEITIPGHGDARVTVTVSTKPATPPGGQYAGVLFEQLPDPSAPATGARILAGQARPLIGRVAGPVVDTGRIVSLAPLRSPAGAGGSLTFVLRFEDTGDVHYALGGTLTISRQGTPIGSVDVPKQLMLPGEIRGVPLTFEGPVEAGELDAQVALTWGTEQQHQGSARATVRVVADTGVDHTSGRPGSTTTFIVSRPTPRALIAIAGLLLLLVLLALSAYWCKRRVDERVRRELATARAA
jgi:hypothetical protein